LIKTLPQQKALEKLSLAEAKELLKEGLFGKGSMEPKMRAAIMFLEETNKDPSREREVIITLPEVVVRPLRVKPALGLPDRGQNSHMAILPYYE
jgi:carbamate kinase